MITELMHGHRLNYILCWLNVHFCTYTCIQVHFSCTCNCISWMHDLGIWVGFKMWGWGWDGDVSCVDGVGTVVKCMVVGWGWDWFALLCCLDVCPQIFCMFLCVYLLILLKTKMVDVAVLLISCGCWQHSGYILVISACRLDTQISHTGIWQCCRWFSPVTNLASTPAVTRVPSVNTAACWSGIVSWYKYSDKLLYSACFRHPTIQTSVV